MTLDAGVRRLVIRTPNWLGDAVMALPAMAGIRSAYAGAHVTVAAPAGIAPLFLERTEAAPDAVLSLTSARQETADLSHGEFDVGLLFPNSFRSALTLRRAGLPQRWGYRGNVRSTLLTRAVRRPRGRVHQVEYYRLLAEGLGCAVPATPPSVAPLPATAARALGFLEKLGVRGGETIVGFAPGAAGGHAKRWPPDRVAAVVARLARERDVVCLLVGAAGDRDAGRAIESALAGSARVVNAIGRTDLRLLVGVIAACRVFVSNDSGAMHLASAVGVPVVGIFGPTDDRVTSPAGPHDVISHTVFCRPCMLRDCPIDHRCMTRISVDEVFTAVSRRLTA